MTALSVSQARAELPALLSRVAAGEEVTITRHGQPVAVLVRPDALRTRRGETALAAAARLHDLLEQARVQPLTAQPGLRDERAEELVEHLREQRDGR